MEVVTILLIAFGLAMYAFAVSITSGLTIKSLKVNYALRNALFFENKIEIIGGLTLIGIGIKILIEHLVLNIA